MNVSSTISAVRLPNAPPIDDLDKLALSILASYSLIILVNSASPPGLSCITVLNEYLLASLVKAVPITLYNVLTSTFPPDITQTTFSSFLGTYYPHNNAAVVTAPAPSATTF